ncbi:MAG: FUSC family protein [Rhodospirillales bacterium]
MTWQSASLRHAARIAAVATPALAATLVWHGAYTHWVTITLVLVMQPFFAITRQHTLRRVAGALLGGAVALLLSLLVRTRAHMAGFLPVLGALALAVRQVNYSVYIAVYTPTVILLVENTLPDDRFWRIALLRAGYTVLGGLLAIVANTLLWPSWEPDRVRADLQAALAAHAAYASAVLNPSPDHDPESARRAAGLSSNNLEASLARAMQEPRRGQRNRFEAVLVADAALRRVGGRLVAISLAGTAGGPVARWVVMALAALAARRPLPPRPGEEGGPMLDRLARQVDLLDEVLARAS